MQIQDSSLIIKAVLEQNIEPSDFHWLQDRTDTLLKEESARRLYLDYSLIGTRIPDQAVDFTGLTGSETLAYLQEHQARCRELSRIYLLARVLEANPGYYTARVAKLIELADTTELVTFLRYLVLLPGAEAFRPAAVEALRTNIAEVFDAIALDNPYPGLFFEESQWNQMYLKAAFMQRELERVQDVDTRANAKLARIISDYAHERWAAGRDIDPYFWRPVSAFLDPSLLGDIKRLLASERTVDNRAAALVLHASGQDKARELLSNYPDLKSRVESADLRWDTLKE